LETNRLNLENHHTWSALFCTAGVSPAFTTQHDKIGLRKKGQDKDYNIIKPGNKFKIKPAGRRRYLKIMMRGLF